MSAETEGFDAFDAANYLNTAEDMAAYLEAAIDESDDDPQVIARALGAIARSRNFSQIARHAGMSREGLYKALSAEGNPSMATVIKVTHALGIRFRFEAAS